MALAPALQGKRVVVVAGAGGVGKTTVSAALGAALARGGASTCVITIDPARRLADALGVELSGSPTRVDLPGASGQLDALMLDVKATFDELVAEHAPTTAQRDAILRNRIYRSLSGSVAGAQEYMAMERLHQLSTAGGYDRIVLDTPPSRNALDFLDAPARLVRFIEGRSLRMFLRPSVRAGRAAGRLAGRGASIGFALLERVTGVALLRDLSDFFVAFDGMVDGFHDRAQAVGSLLASPRATFLVVAAPTDEPVHEAEFLVRALRDRGLPLGGVIANRVHEPALDPDDDLDGIAAEAGDGLRRIGADDGLADRAVRALLEHERRARREAALLARLQAHAGGAPLVRLPHMPEGLGGLDDLAALARPLGLAESPALA